MGPLDRLTGAAHELAQRIRLAAAAYPSQFWILFWGMLVRAVGRSMITPFLAIYMRETLALPLATIGFLRTLNSGVGVISAALVGPAVDRFGRESGVVLSLMVIGGLVVLFQMTVARLTAAYRLLRVLAVGSLVWALGVGSVALGRGFAAFLASMVVITVGEMIVMPSAKTVAASLSPPTMRGKYMGVYDAAGVISFGLGPLLAGFLNDTVGPSAMWYAGLVLGVLAGGLFVRLDRR